MSQPTHPYKYYDLLTAAFVTILICSNVISASKVTTLWGFDFGAGILIFPISYIFGDVLTEVYGYARARRVVWTGFASLLFVSFISWLIVALPPAKGWPYQKEYETIFSMTPRIALSSLIAFFAGEFSNSYVLAKMKILTSGRLLWSRTIGSTIVGEGIDSLVFYPLAFWGIWPGEMVVRVMITNYILKVLWEVVLTPVTYKVVNSLKKKEHEDYFDRKTDFNPFLLKVG
ncbi:MAG: queuosine precursor transporter [Deltaproteobacteria bacterium]|nr:queuosine precursor transporter [Deltaproteobacteria bacterium]